MRKNSEDIKERIESCAHLRAVRLGRHWVWHLSLPTLIGRGRAIAEWEDIVNSLFSRAGSLTLWTPFGDSFGRDSHFESFIQMPALAEETYGVHYGDCMLFFPALSEFERTEISDGMVVCGPDLGSIEGFGSLAILYCYPDNTEWEIRLRKQDSSN